MTIVKNNIIKTENEHWSKITQLEDDIRSIINSISQYEENIGKLKNDSIVEKVRGFGDSGIHLLERKIVISEKSPSPIVNVSIKMQHNCVSLKVKYLEDRHKVQVEFEPTFIALGQKKN